MNFPYLFFVLIIFIWNLVHAQQACYWPDGSDASITNGTVMGTVNCDPSQDSACCYPTDICMSNGLCFASGSDTVRSMRSSIALFDTSKTSQTPNEL